MQKAVKLMNDFNVLVSPLQLRSNEDTVLRIFRANNFDENLEKETGGGAVKMTTIMAFQEISDHAVSTEHKISIPKIWSRNVNVDFGKHDITLLHENFAVSRSSSKNHEIKMPRKKF